jgi:Na+-transporting NADH:ubiquinone oxidoreductase subunit C
MQQRKYSTLYTLGFAAAVCIVCSFLVSTAAVTLQQRQKENRILDKRINVLSAIGFIEPGQPVTEKEVDALFEDIEPVVVNLQTGEVNESINPATFDQQDAMYDPKRSRKAPVNRAKVQRLPNHALVYKVYDESGNLDMVVLPVEGKGLWSTLYGFLALDSDLRTIQGITFYQHGETPGLGGEIENPKWQKIWQDRKAFGEDWEPKIQVIKGPAGPPEEDPYKVDGLSGATITGRGVTALVQFWLGEHGFLPYLKKLHQRRQTAWAVPATGPSGVA